MHVKANFYQNEITLFLTIDRAKAPPPLSKPNMSGSKQAILRDRKGEQSKLLDVRHRLLMRNLIQTG